MIEKKVNTKNAKSVPSVTAIFGNKFAIPKAMTEHKIVAKADPAAFTLVGNSSLANAHGMLAKPEMRT